MSGKRYTGLEALVAAKKGAKMQADADEPGLYLYMDEMTYRFCKNRPELRLRELSDGDIGRIAMGSFAAWSEYVPPERWEISPDVTVEIFNHQDDGCWARLKKTSESTDKNFGLPADFLVKIPD